MVVVIVLAVATKSKHHAFVLSHFSLRRCRARAAAIAAAAAASDAGTNAATTSSNEEGTITQQLSQILPQLREI